MRLVLPSLKNNPFRSKRTEQEASSATLTTIDSQTTSQLASLDYGDEESVCSTTVSVTSSDVRVRFDPSQYAIVYEEMMASNEARQVFGHFLKLYYNEEPLLFVTEVNNYRLEYTKRLKETLTNGDDFKNDSSHVLSMKITRNHVMALFEKSREILVKYVLTGGLELNLGVSHKKLIDFWNNVVCVCLETIREHPEREELTPVEECEIFNAISLLDPETLFSDILVGINLGLKFDQFPRFARSVMAMKFLVEKGEAYARTIAIDISKGFNIDIRFKPHHLKDRIIDDNFIYFGM